MAKYLIDENTVTNIANTIRTLTGNEENISGNNLSSSLINAISNKVDAPSGALNIVENGNNIDVSAYAIANVQVPVPTMPDEYCIGGTIINNNLIGYHFPQNTSIISLPHNSYFEGCTTLKYIENFPQSLITIKQQTFQDCNKLKSIELPNGLTTIEYRAFLNCYDLVLTELPESVINLGQGAFQNCTNITFDYLPNGITDLPNQTFYGCSKLALLDLPSNLKTIGSNCFYNCSEILLTNLPNKLTRIDAFAFQDCSKIALSELPSSITTLGQGVFKNCISLQSIRFNSTPTSSITGNFFQGCTNLINIYVPWSEGEIANAPWGATNATITYNYTGGNI